MHVLHTNNVGIVARDRRKGKGKAIDRSSPILYYMECYTYALVSPADSH